MTRYSNPTRSALVLVLLAVGGALACACGGAKVDAGRSTDLRAKLARQWVFSVESCEDVVSAGLAVRFHDIMGSGIRWNDGNESLRARWNQFRAARLGFEFDPDGSWGNHCRVLYERDQSSSQLQLGVPTRHFTGGSWELHADGSLIVELIDDWFGSRTLSGSFDGRVVVLLIPGSELRVQFEPASELRTLYRDTDIFRTTNALEAISERKFARPDGSSVRLNWDYFVAALSASLREVDTDQSIFTHSLELEQRGTVLLEAVECLCAAGRLGLASELLAAISDQVPSRVRVHCLGIMAGHHVLAGEYSIGEDLASRIRAAEGVMRDDRGAALRVFGSAFAQVGRIDRAHREFALALGGGLELDPALSAALLLQSIAAAGELDLALQEFDGLLEHPSASLTYAGYSRLGESAERVRSAIVEAGVTALARAGQWDSISDRLQELDRFNALSDEPVLALLGNLAARAPNSELVRWCSEGPVAEGIGADRRRALRNAWQVQLAITHALRRDWPASIAVLDGLDEATLERQDQIFLALVLAEFDGERAKSLLDSACRGLDPRAAGFTAALVVAAAVDPSRHEQLRDHAERVGLPEDPAVEAFVAGARLTQALRANDGDSAARILEGLIAGGGAAREFAGRTEFLRVLGETLARNELDPVPVEDADVSSIDRAALSVGALRSLLPDRMRQDFNTYFVGR